MICNSLFYHLNGSKTIVHCNPIIFISQYPFIRPSKFNLHLQTHTHTLCYYVYIFQFDEGGTMRYDDKYYRKNPGARHKMSIVAICVDATLVNKLQPAALEKIQQYRQVIFDKGKKPNMIGGSCVH